ncbi:unnamed protein product [Darwinula stevensoni]|uniref:Uncharacterized protein n=1 Tax=Darwinula stevensoni TaxID=69355 RepID=A0A7R9FRC7_9CRUS|nr:unnamed protein product [Darwinula stevensoni]CAG0900763.1 unnamed protein product [Darwinula stevensoni]
MRTSEEVPQFEGKETERILQILTQKGVKWMYKNFPPAPLDIKKIVKGSSGVLESISISLTGSLLLLPLLQVCHYPAF